MTKAFRNLFCVFVVLGALGKEVVQRYYSSPGPEPRLGRTVAALGTDGGTVYITPQTDRLFWALFALCAVTFACWIFWPGKKKRTQMLPSSSVSPSAAATRLTFYWQHRKWKRYGFTVAAVALTSYVWVTERGNLGWMPRIVFLLIALWSLRMLIDYRTCIDTETGIFEREKLLFGRYRVGALRLPLTEFTAVVLDCYEDSDDSTVTFYVCLKHRTGGLRQVCYFEIRGGQRREAAEKTAREIAEVTGLQYEEVV